VKKILDTYFTRIYIIKAFVIALCLSAFIYLAYFDLRISLLNSLLAAAGFYLLLGENRVVYFWSGFFIGLLWFYWISFSFVYYDLAFLIPLIILGVALCYAFLFWLIARFCANAFLQSALLTCTVFIAPFGFNWLKLDLIFLDTFMRPTWWALALFLSALSLLKQPSRILKTFALLPLLASLSYHETHVTPPKIDVALPAMHVPQSQRWDKAYQEAALHQNFALIEEAIAQGKQLIILPESAFPMYLNLAPAVIEKLLAYSKDIAIVAGALTYEEKQGFFNSAYFFHNGRMQIAHKVVLVPFGEEVPFPAFIVDIVNKIFFDGAKDYQKAKTPHNFTINDLTFRSAICFEATRDELFQGRPKYMIAMSNNAWFSPSTEQTLQHLLLRYYAKKYQTVIYHSANSGINGVILP
jgi:apolipoprotein N-acyltransferase